MDKKEYRYQWSGKADSGEIIVVRSDVWEDLILDITKARLEVYQDKRPGSIKTPVESHPERKYEMIYQDREVAQKTETITRVPEAMEIAQERAECDHAEFWVNTVKKEGKNQGRQFKSCKKCKAFIGFI